MLWGFLPNDEDNLVERLLSGAGWVALAAFLLVLVEQCAGNC
jgi:hypothetical protein